MKKEVPEIRFWRHVEKLPNGCWLWTGTKTSMGYGRLYIINQSDNKSVRVLAHRLAYEIFVGPIPDGLTIDHLCRNRPCVNPEHLEAITLQDNILRGIGSAARNAKKTHCPQGHPYDLLNTYIRANGWRVCHRCKIHTDKLYRLKKEMEYSVG